MKHKMLFVTSALCLLLSVPALGSESDLEARVAALEARVAELEAILSGSSAGTVEDGSPSLAPATEPITLGTGTWIVGEDIPAGKYNIVCEDGYGSVKLYNDYETRKAKDYDYFESYLLMSESYLEITRSQLGDDFASSLMGMYTFEVNNVRLEDGNCIYNDSVTVDFIPKQ